VVHFLLLGQKVPGNEHKKYDSKNFSHVAKINPFYSETNKVIFYCILI